MCQFQEACAILSDCILASCKEGQEVTRVSSQTDVRALLEIGENTGCVDDITCSRIIYLYPGTVSIVRRQLSLYGSRG